MICSLYGVFFPLLFFAAISILRFLLMTEKKMNVFFPQVLATWRLYLFTVKVPTKVNAPPLPAEFHGFRLSTLISW